VKTIITGDRHFEDYNFVKQKLDEILKEIPATEIVSGDSKGIDILGERYATENNIPVKKFKANWNKHGRAAEPIRNQKMANYAERLIAFDGGGPGTRNMIFQARCLDLVCEIINV